MKKLIAAILVTCGMATFADRTPAELRAEFLAENATNRANITTWYGKVTESEWRVYGDWCAGVAATNRMLAKSYVYSPDIIGILADSKNGAFTSEYDQKLSASGIGTGFPYRYFKLPKLSESWIADPTNAVSVSRLGASIAFCRRTGDFKYWIDASSVAEYANIQTELFRLGNYNLDKMLDAIVKRATKEIKRRMRQAGMKIVVEGDTNPVQVEMDKLTAALNAPRFAGLKEWFAKYYPEYKWVDQQFESDESVNALKDAIYNGEHKFGEREKNILRVNLGLVRYNEFIEEYNN